MDGVGKTSLSNSNNIIIIEYTVCILLCMYMYTYIFLLYSITTRLRIAPRRCLHYEVVAVAAVAAVIHRLDSSKSRMELP